MTLDVLAGHFGRDIVFLCHIGAQGIIIRIGVLDRNRISSGEIEYDDVVALNM